MTAVKHRDSSLELYRIIVMLGIIAHHYVINSCVGCLMREGDSIRNAFFFAFGAWGKIGINCFVLITGYFMCKSRISLQKFFKLYFEVVFYGVVCNAVFVLSGYAPFSPKMLVDVFFPFREVGNGFVSGFLVFYLTIPYLNILIVNMNKRLHALLIALTVIVFSCFPMFPNQSITINYVIWFDVLYLISSYVRLYPTALTETRLPWGIGSLFSFAIVIAGSILAQHSKFFSRWFLCDSEMLTQLVAAFCFFMFFKNLHLRYSKWINTIASTCFGVLLIHGNSNIMRRWLWGGGMRQCLLVSNAVLRVSRHCVGRVDFCGLCGDRFVAAALYRATCNGLPIQGGIKHG